MTFLNEMYCQVSLKIYIFNFSLHCGNFERIYKIDIFHYKIFVWNILPCLYIDFVKLVIKMVMKHNCFAIKMPLPILALKLFYSLVCYVGKF